MAHHRHLNQLCLRFQIYLFPNDRDSKGNLDQKNEAKFCTFSFL